MAIRMVDGVAVELTPEEAAEREADEQRYLAEKAAEPPPPPSIQDELAALRKAVLTGVKTDLEAIDTARRSRGRP